MAAFKYVHLIRVSYGKGVTAAVTPYMFTVQFDSRNNDSVSYSIGSNTSATIADRLFRSIAVMLGKTVRIFLQQVVDDDSENQRAGNGSDGDSSECQ